jgi:CheY-like chemotaxis protein/HPt (histidine-containing phosphotransfer) domain-containing protein
MEELYGALVAIISGMPQPVELVTRHSVRETHSCCNILVADDVEINRELLRANLEKQGHHIVMAENGREAVNTFSEGRFDIIFMDMQMPILDGYGAVREIREIEQARNEARTPIVAMTAYAMQGDREKCLMADMDAYLSKPAKASEIIATINQLVPDYSSATDTVTLNPPPVVPTGSEDSEPVFDRKELIDRLGGREEMLGHFIDMFCRNAAGYMELLASAVQQGDLEQMRIQAHTIKGAAGNISARRLRQTAAEMEAHAREGRFAEASALLQNCQDDLRAFNQEISALK